MATAAAAANRLPITNFVILIPPSSLMEGVDWGSQTVAVELFPFSPDL